MCVCTCVLQSMCGGWRTTCRSQYAPSLMWVLRIRLRPSGMETKAFTHRAILPIRDKIFRLCFSLDFVVFCSFLFLFYIFIYLFSLVAWDKVSFSSSDWPQARYINCVTQTGFETEKESSCLRLPSMGILDVRHHTHLLCFVSFLFCWIYLYD